MISSRRIIISNKSGDEKSGSDHQSFGLVPDERRGEVGGRDASFTNTSCLDRFMSKLTFNVGNVESFNVIPICKVNAIFQVTFRVH